MKHLTILASAWLLAANVAWAEDMQEQAAFPFSFAITAGQQVTVASDKGKISAKLPGGATQALAEIELAEPSTEEGAPQFPAAQVADFNFDGMQDVGIQDGIGYNGVNLFYRVFLWDKASSKFSEYPEAISNPALDVANKTLTSSSRSGPAWSYTQFHIAKGKLYPALDSTMLSVGDGAWEYVTFKDVAGKVTGHKVVGEAGGEAGTVYADLPDATATIEADKATLYDKPKASSKTKMYVIKGDKVTLLDWKAGDDGDFGFGWFLARYQGKKVIEKWIEGSALVKP